MKTKRPKRVWTKPLIVDLDFKHTKSGIDMFSAELTSMTTFTFAPSS